MDPNSALFKAILALDASADVDRRLTETVRQPMRLGPDERKSGELAWIVAEHS